MKQEISPLKQALIAIEEMQQRLKAYEYERKEPIAIIGMGCRFPGNIKTPEDYWQLLSGGKNTRREFPGDRLVLNSVYDKTLNTPQKINTKYGYFLDQLDLFDPQFFEISPLEAEQLDPQHRLILEVTWEALENSGQPWERLKNSNTGIFMGLVQFDYAQCMILETGIKNINGSTGSGNAFCFATGRLSYLLGLQGPSVAFDTACSSSLVAVHYACNSLRNRECDLALAGGVQCNLSPFPFLYLSQARAISPDGLCKTFDESADGYGRGEGCGVIVLKRLSEAIKDRDYIYAVIKGSAINHDGPSSGLTVPNGFAEEKVIHKAIEFAGVDINDIAYIETHGPGTSLGDQIEIRAINRVFENKRTVNNPVYIGSTKTNIGHLEGAAGIAGLMKVVLSLINAQVPAHLNIDNPNTVVPWEKMPVRVAREHMKWPLPGEKRIAGVNSFGLSGTNSHVVLENAPMQNKVRPKVERDYHILTLSAKNNAALKDTLKKFKEFLEKDKTNLIGDICYTANTGRKVFNQRAAIVAADKKELIEKISSLLDNKNTVGAFQGANNPNQHVKIAFLFTGQGSQYINMGQGLYKTQPVFKKYIDQCDVLLKSERYLGKSLLEVIYPEDGNDQLINETIYAQPAIFAIEYALAKLWESWGIFPHAVIGHSLGEYAASCIAGVFSLEDGLYLLTQRGKLVSRIKTPGKMVNVYTGEERIKGIIEPYKHIVSIAAINGPDMVVISGEVKAVDKILDIFENNRIRYTSLGISQAFHSPLTDEIIQEFRQTAATIQYHKAKLPLISNVTGQVIKNDGVLDADYWCRHLREPVNFFAGIQNLHRKKFDTLIEIGPEPALLGLDQCLPVGLGADADTPIKWLPSIRPELNNWEQILETLAVLFINGVNINWENFDKDYVRYKTALPTYPFQRKKYWFNRDKVDVIGIKEGNLNHDYQSDILKHIATGKIEALTKTVMEHATLIQKEQDLLPSLFEVICEQHQNQVISNKLAEWLFAFEWVRQEQFQFKEIDPERENTWIIFADQEKIGEALAELLHKQGVEAYLVYYSDTQKVIVQDKKIIINLNTKVHYEELFQIVLKNNKGKKIKLLHLWSMDILFDSVKSPDDIEEKQRISSLSMLHITKAVLNLKDNKNFAIWIGTRHAMPVKTDIYHPLNIFQSPIWGLGKAISLEQPELWGGMIDLGDEDIDSGVKIFITEISRPDFEDHIAYRDNYRYILRLVKEKAAMGKQISVKPDGTYLIAGGLGTLGLHTAAWLARNGAKHLVLTSRSGNTTANQAKISHLLNKGVSVTTLKADVSKLEDMENVFRIINESGAHLLGIFQLAGLTDYKPLEDLDEENMLAVLAPKMRGTWVLHLLTQKMDLDFLISYSSVSSIWGSKGEAHYGAANLFLDVYAHYRRTNTGENIFSINYGPWSGGGLAEPQYLEILDQIGVVPLAPENAISALNFLLTAQYTQLIVIDMNWLKFIGILEIKRLRPMFNLIKEDLQLLNETGLTSKQNNHLIIIDKLRSLSPKESNLFLINYIRERIAEILRFKDELPDVHTGFFEMGLNSIMALELKNKLQTGLGISLPSTLLFNYPNIELLSQYIFTDILKLYSNTIKEEEITELQEIIDDLSESELEDLLDKKLEQASIIDHNKR